MRLAPVDDRVPTPRRIDSFPEGLERGIEATAHVQSVQQVWLFIVLEDIGAG